MGRKDAERFKAIEDRLNDLEENEKEMIKIQINIQKKWQQSIIQLRDIYNKLIEGE